MARLVIVVGCLASLAGCMDSSGNRISMQEWWASRTEKKKPDAPAQEPTVEPAATAASQEPTDPPPRRDTYLASQKDRPGEEPAPRSAEDSPNAVRADHLVVDDEVIRVQDILEPLQSRLPTLESELSADQYWRKVGELIRQQIIEAVAQHLIWRRAQETLHDELKPQLDKAVEKMEKDRINREFGGRETAYAKYLSKHGKSRDEVRERLRKSVLIDSYLRDRLLPMVPQARKQELQAYYNSHLTDFSKEGRREMYLIDVPVASFLDLSRPMTREDERLATEKARGTIEKAAAALKEGRPFADVAKEFSYGLHKDEGGYWGWISQPTDATSAPLQGHWEAPSRKLFELKAGETSDIIDAARSFFIVRVGAIEEASRLSFQDAQPEITNALRQQRFVKLRADFLQKELDRSTIGSLDAFVRAVLNAVPTQVNATTESGGDQDAIPSRSPRLKTDNARKGPAPRD